MQNYEKKQIGIFSGSFNPIHMGHVMLANYITEFTYVEEIWFVVSPHNPMKKKVELENDKTRLEMCKIAVEEMENLKVSDIEFSMPKPSYTIDTLDKLKKLYSEFDFTLIIGADNWHNFHLWKDYEKIIDNHKIMIYPRLGDKPVIDEKYKNKIRVCNAPIIEISSTFIRKSVFEGKHISSFLPQGVYEYILMKNLYK